VIISVEDFLEERKQLSTIDVRSPLEFAEGHIPNAINIPLLNNEERIAVGTDYKQKGQREAIRTGLTLVGPRLNEITTEAERIANGKEIIIHCWRGGMRSKNFAQFAGMVGIQSKVVAGGYKAYRQLAIESFRKPFSILRIGGNTGSGKSEVLRALEKNGEQIIDLEAMANHKGSAFGGLGFSPQPTTEQFQNELFEKILTLDLSKRIWVEDESIAVGKIFLPEDFWRTMLTSPIILMQVEKEIRVKRLVNEYGDSNPEEFLDAMKKITKRLGGQNFLAAKEKLDEGDMHATISILLEHYYDKAYERSTGKKSQLVKSSVPWNGEDAETFAQELIAVTKK
jgi:tRNA 2-selenouridine synthase